MNRAKQNLLDYSTSRLIRDLFPYLRPYAGRIFLATLFRAVSDIADLYPAYALASIVTFLTAYHAGVSLQPIYMIIALSIGAVLVTYISAYCAKMIMYAASERIDLNLQNATINHLFRIDIAWHEQENTGNKLKKLNRGADSVDRIMRIWINNMISIAINFVGIAIVIARFDQTVAILTAFFLATYYVVSRFVRVRAAHATIIANVQEEEVEGLLFEALNNIRTVKVLGMARILMRRITEASDDLYEKIRRRLFWFQTGNSSRSAYSQIFQVAMLAFIVFGVIHGKYEVGFLVLFTTYFSKLLSAARELADVTQDYVVSKLSIGRLFEMMHEPVRIDVAEGKKAFPAEWKTISFRHVSFSYGGNEVLQNITFNIERGQKIGVVGLSGAGKSTLFKLLLKEHESYTGDIYIDDVPLRDISRQEYFNHAAVVLQDTEVFNFSLRDNILLANTTESENARLFDKALRVAHVKDFLPRLPEGIETFIGEKGVRLSGGERQRVGIARAVFKNPELLLLDEATSHLDVESEGKIQDSLHEFFNSVTAVVIAHRLTTIKEMDTIIVLEGGRILESGNFAELQAKKGRFHELWEQQWL